MTRKETLFEMFQMAAIVNIGIKPVMQVSTSILPSNKYQFNSTYGLESYIVKNNQDGYHGSHFGYQKSYLSNIEFPCCP